MGKKGNKYYTGNKGRIWINDTNYAECYKAEAKRTDEYEEIWNPSGNGKVQIPIGYSIEGALTLRKQGSEEVVTQLVSDKNHELEVSLVIKEENPHTGKIERKKYTGVTFNEIMLSQFEKGAVREIELPFKAEDYEVL